MWIYFFYDYWAMLKGAAMREYVVMTDSDTEIPYYFADEHNVPVFLMPYTLGDDEKLFDLGRETDFKGFFDAVRSGVKASTSTRPPYDIQMFFEDILKTGKDILYIAFSSKLSGHMDLALKAREDALADYPDMRIEIVDSLSIAMGAGQLVYHAVRLHEEGKSLDEVRDWVIDNRMKALHFFTVDSLMYLKNTGRVNAVTATFGTILDLKPVLLLKRDGSIVAYDKVKGRKKAVRYLMDKVEENLTDDPVSHDLLIIYHADNPAAAEQMKEEAESRFDFKKVLVMDVGPVIGAHCGPGTLAVCFMGKERPE